MIDIKPKIKDTDIVNQYADYLSKCIADMRFMNVSNLKEYLTSHLQLFFSEAIDATLFDELDNHVNVLESQKKRLQIERADMDESLLIAKEKLKKKQYVDMDWFAKANYAYKMKGIQIQNICIEVKKIANIKKKHNIEIHLGKDSIEFGWLKERVKKGMSEKEYADLWAQLRAENAGRYADGV